MEVSLIGGTSQTFFKSSNQTIKSGGHKIKKKKKIIYDQGGDEEDESWEKIITQTKIKIKKGKKSKPKGTEVEYYESGESDEQGNVDIPGCYSMYMSNQLDITFRTPKPAMCMTWNGNKVKTFDGVMYNASLHCSHTLVQDYVDGSFSVILRACPFSSTNGGVCPYALEIFLQSLQYTFDLDSKFLKLIILFQVNLI